MPQLFDLPQPLSLAIAMLIPLLTQPLSGWLQDDGLPAFVNAAIVVLYLLVTSAICMLVGGKVTGVLPVDAAAYFAVVYLISQTDQMQQLEARFMVNVPSPFSLFVKKPMVVSSKVAPIKLRASLPIQPSIANGPQQVTTPGTTGDVTSIDTAPQVVPPSSPDNSDLAG